MNIQDWIPPISTTAIFAAVLWLLRSVILTRLKASVKHEFDNKLESLKSDLRENEELIKNKLKEREDEIQSLRSGALSALTNRQTELDKRRIEAVDQIWDAIQTLEPAKWISANMAVVKFESAAKLCEKNQNARALFTAVYGSFDHKTTFTHKAANARPFISHSAWAFFSAYQSILSISVLKLKALCTGAEDAAEMVNSEPVEKMIAAALPHQVDLIKQYGGNAYHSLLDELESRLLDELQKTLKGVESDRASIEQAARIIEASNQIRREISKADTPDSGIETIDS